MGPINYGVQTGINIIQQTPVSNTLPMFGMLNLNPNPLHAVPPVQLDYQVSNVNCRPNLNLNNNITDQLTQGINRLALSSNISQNQNNTIPVTAKTSKIPDENLDSIDSGTTSQESNNNADIIVKSCKRSNNRRRVRNRNSASVCFSNCYKIIENPSNNNNIKEKCFNELRQLQRCKKAANDQNILQFHEFHEDKDYYYIVTDYIPGGNLSDRLIEGQPLTEYESASICRDMAKALDFLHSQRICHRDIKPQNILCADLEKITPVILSDFDLSSAADDYNSHGSASSSLGNSYDNDCRGHANTRRSPYNQSPISYFSAGNISPYSMDGGNSSPWSEHLSRDFPIMEMDSPVGSPEYMSPEIAKRFLIDDDEMGFIEKYSEKTDIWSLGVLLYKCLSGDVPYKAIGCEDIYCQWEEGKSCEDCQISLWEEICQSKLEFRSKHWKNVSVQAKHLVVKMLDPDVEQRIGAAEILDHPFIRCLNQIQRENKRLAQNCESANNSTNTIVNTTENQSQKPDCVKKLDLSNEQKDQEFEICQSEKPNYNEINDISSEQNLNNNYSKTQEKEKRDEREIELKQLQQEKPITDLNKLEEKMLFYFQDRFEFQLIDEQYYEVSLIENDYLYDSLTNYDSGHPVYGQNYAHY